MRASILSLVALLAACVLTAQQAPAPTPQSQLEAARAQNASLNALIQGAGAARSLKSFMEAKTLLERSEASMRAQRDALVNSTILYELATGGGVNGAQRAF